MMRKGTTLLKYLKSQPGAQSRDCYRLHEPVPVRVFHRLIEWTGGEIIDHDVWTEYWVRELWSNCFFGDCERVIDSKPWWAVLDWEEVKEDGL